MSEETSRCQSWQSVYVLVFEKARQLKKDLTAFGCDQWRRLRETGHWYRTFVGVSFWPNMCVKTAPWTKRPNPEVVQISIQLDETPH